MPNDANNGLQKRFVVSVFGVLCSALPQGKAWAVCNGGVTVTSTLVVSASCAGGNVKPLTLDTGANVTINAGVTVSNDAPSNRNGDPVSVLSSSTSSSLTNNGTISTASQFGVTVNGTLTTLINTGRISSGVRRGVVLNGGTITTLTNTGSIIGPFSAITNNAGVLNTLNNLQGAGNANGALTYTGALPVDYRIIINSPSTYGKLTASAVTGSMTFGIYGTSTVAVGTYAGVLNGLTAGNLTGGTSGTYGGLNWQLGLASGSTTIWDLVFSIASVNMTTGSIYSLSDVGVTANPVFAGGTLALLSGDNSSRAFTLNAGGGTITAPTSGSAQLSGAFSGVGGLTVNGTGALLLTGNNSYSGGTTINSGTLVIGGASPLGTGPVFVGSGSTLMGTGTVRGPVTVAGTLKPGNSPGYLAVNSTVTMAGGSTYQQDIAGTVQASAASPAGATGYYSFLSVTGGQFVIQPNATLTPRLSGLFTPAESGFGSRPYVPVLGDRFRIVSADGGISGRFSVLTQPAELSADTQFVQLYNVGGSNSLDLAVIPRSYTATLSAQNANARSAASALDRIVLANQAGSTSSAQGQLLSAASVQTAASLPAFTRGLAGEVHGASLAALPQAALRAQQAVMSHLDGTASSPVAGAFSASRSPGVLVASAGSDVHIGALDGASNGTATRGPAWGDVTYQRGKRRGDQNASGFSNDLYQLVAGIDAYAEHGAKAGGGITLSNTHVTADQGTGDIQQGSVFLYGKLAVDGWVLDGMASLGLSSTNNSRSDPTGNTAGLEAKNIRSNHALLSAGLSRPADLESARITPYARLTWQQVRQSSFAEGSSAAALSVDSFSGRAVRGVIGLTLGSRSTNPLKEVNTYLVNVAAGADSSGLINPVLNASLVGTATTIGTPRAGSTFVQAGFYGTRRFAANAFAYLGVAGELRRGARQGMLSAGMQMQF
ncbi:autotransporter domain-containing protein [Polaromonas sp. CT11-55]|uniref:autotransporter family protein n=1 Tax=Polaromonas sp. CT11-55 TaxID=3243045 RepID=UPI0039A4419A